MRRALLVLATCAIAASGASAAPTQTATCSAAHEPTALPKQNLPAKVAARRQAIVNAAVACDFAKLERLAGKQFTYSYGGGSSAAAYWRTVEAKRIDRPLQRLVRILSVRVTRNETNWFAWPSAYTDKPTAADWNALVSGGVYTAAEVRRMRAGKTYYGYRTAISPDGRWRFFVAGD